MSTSSAGFTVKISGSPELIHDLQTVIAEHPESMTLKSVGPASDPARLQLSLAEVSTIVAILNGVATFTKLAYAAYQTLKHKGEGGVTVQTPLRTVVILASDATSAERVQELMEAAATA